MKPKKARACRPTEFDLVSDVHGRLKKIPGISPCFEVPLMGRSVDLAYIHKRSVVTVEFKLRDWKRAILQAKDHLLGADYAYICLPARAISEELRRVLREVGVGLLFYSKTGDWPFETAIEACRSRETWSVARSGVIKYIKANLGVTP